MPDTYNFGAAPATAPARKRRSSSQFYDYESESEKLSKFWLDPNPKKVGF
jgi:hypothetical protein